MTSPVKLLASPVFSLATVALTVALVSTQQPANAQAQVLPSPSASETSEPARFPGSVDPAWLAAPEAIAASHHAGTRPDAQAGNQAGNHLGTQAGELAPKHSTPDAASQTLAEDLSGEAAGEVAAAAYGSRTQQTLARASIQPAQPAQPVLQQSALPQPALRSNLVSRSGTRDDAADAPLDRAWKLSLAPLVASQALDAASSFGRRELNPLLAGSDGRFGVKALAIKLGVTGGAIGVEYWIVKKWPKTARALSYFNLTSSVLTTGLAVHNFRLP